MGESDKIEVVSVVNLQNYVNGYMDLHRLLELRFKIPISSIPIIQEKVIVHEPK